MKFASAPVSYGVFGDLDLSGVLTTEGLLDSMANAGYTGTELGPPGFFGPVGTLAPRFRNAGLTAVGAYVPLHTQDTGAVLERDLERMLLTCREIAAVNPDALVILADEGDENLLRHPRKEPEDALDDDGWDRLTRVISDAARSARASGLRVSFHPHISTYVETPDEIERLLADTDVDLTYDIGHIVLAGGDGLALYRAWQDRINHVHVKDVRRAVLEEARAVSDADFDTWWSRVCTPLGDGDVDMAGFIELLQYTSYSGWVVVEQDGAPLTSENLTHVLADQAANLRWLEDRTTSAATHTTFERKS